MHDFNIIYAGKIIKRINTWPVRPKNPTKRCLKSHSSSDYILSVARDAINP